MATLTSILNLVSCGASAVLGTGGVGCKPFLTKVASIWLLPSGTVLDGSQTLNKTYIQLLQAQGNLIILKGIENFTDNTPDDVVEEFESGVKKHVRKAKPEFVAQFSKGLYFNAALNSLNSNASYDCIFVDVDGGILGTQSTNGSLKGFTVGMLQKQKLVWATDSTAQREGIMFQFTVPNELDDDYVFIDNGQLDFSPETLDGINEIVLSISAPTNLDTTLTITATRKQDGAAFTGAASSDFLITDQGVTNNPSGGDDSTTAGTYVLTGFTAFDTGDAITAQLYDNSNSRSVINLSEVLYKSNTATATTVA